MIRTAARLALTAALLVPHLSAARAQPADAAALAAYQGADREQRLLAGAKKEGELKLYSSMQLASIAPLQRAFEKKYGVRIDDLARLGQGHPAARDHRGEGRPRRRRRHGERRLRA